MSKQNLPRNVAQARSAAAGMAKATAGRSRVFEARTGVPDSAQDIAERVEAYRQEEEEAEASLENPNEYADWDG